MSKKTQILERLEAAGLKQSEDDLVKTLIADLQSRRGNDWIHMLSDFRKHYYSLFDVIIPAVSEIESDMIKFALIGFLDPNKPKEKRVLESMAENIDPKHSPILVERMHKLDIGVGTKKA